MAYYVNTRSFRVYDGILCEHSGLRSPSCEWMSVVNVAASNTAYTAVEHVR